MDLSTIAKPIKTAGDALKRHSPNILVGLGTIGTITTVIFAVRATPKALRIIQEETENYTDPRPDWIVQTALDTNLTKVDILKRTWRCYLPTVGMGVASIACFWGARYIDSTRQVALAGAYSLAETALKEYQDKVVDILGEEADKTVREAVAKEHVEPEQATEVVVTDGNGKCLCMDSFSGRYFKSDKESIIHLANQFNQRLISDSELTMNDWYEDLGLEPLYPIGDFLGWSRETQLLDISFSAVMAANGEPCIYVEYRRPIMQYLC